MDFNKKHQRREITGQSCGGESHYACNKRPREPKELIKAQVMFHIYLHAQGHTHKAEGSRGLCITNVIKAKLLISFMHTVWIFNTTPQVVNRF